MGINIYINVAVMGSVNPVLNKLLDRIDSSGLYDKVNKIFLVVNGQKDLLYIPDKPKYFVWNPHEGTARCEFPTLDLIWEHCQKEKDLTVLYLHTKGVTKPNNQFVKDWTEYLSYFNIDKWEDRLVELKYNDATGVNLNGNEKDLLEPVETWGYGKAPKHYSGNFWWSKSSHIKKLLKPYDIIPDENYFRYRIACEMWLCSEPGKFYEAHSSGVNHYTNLYPREMYVKEVSDPETPID